jgi:hypothetical protein
MRNCNLNLPVAILKTCQYQLQQPSGILHTIVLLTRVSSLCYILPPSIVVVNGVVLYDALEKLHFRLLVSIEYRIRN